MERRPGAGTLTPSTPPPDAPPRPADPHGLRTVDVAWHLLAAVLVVLLPSRLLLGMGLSTLPDHLLRVPLAMGLGYLAAVLLAGWRGSLDGGWPRRALRLALAAGVGIGLAWGMLLLRPGVAYSRAVVAASGALALLLLAVPTLVRLRPRLEWAGLGALAVGVGVLLVIEFPRTTPVRTATHRYVLSAYHGIRLTRHPEAYPREDAHSGGGLTRLDDRLLLATGSGALHIIHPTGGRPESRRIDIASPVDPAAFAAALPWANVHLFRVLDVAARRRGEGWDIFLSHHVWSPERACFTVRVSAGTVDGELRGSLGDERPWRPVFEAEPCIPFLQGEELLFEGHESGGRLAWAGEDRLLLVTGDADVPSLVQEDGDHGKVIELDLSAEPAVVRRLALGLRNPQGLVVTAGGAVWETEHGPRGGDELNRIEAGANYGWPATSLGTDYTGLGFSPRAVVRDTAALRPPVYAWIPSIGVTSLVEVEGAGFDRWAGDLLVASLRRRAIFRLRLEGERVVASEELHVGQRIRDLEEDRDGRIWLMTDRSLLLALEADRELGSTIGTCLGCHPAGDWTGIGPSLAGVMGRPVGDLWDYDYSPALRSMGGRWTRERLDAFIADPRAFAPGTSMDVEGVADPGARDRILDYLESMDPQAEAVVR